MTAVPKVQMERYTEVIQHILWAAEQYETAVELSDLIGDSLNRVECVRRALYLIQLVDCTIGTIQYRGIVDQIGQYLNVVQILKNRDCTLKDRVQTAYCTYYRNVVKKSRDKLVEGFGLELVEYMEQYS